MEEALDIQVLERNRCLGKKSVPLGNLRGYFLVPLCPSEKGQSKANTKSHFKHLTMLSSCYYSHELSIHYLILCNLAYVLCNLG